MKYGDYIQREADDQRREEHQELKDRFGDAPTYPTRKGYFVMRAVDLAKAIRIAIASVCLIATTYAGNASPTPQEQLQRAQYLMGAVIDPGDLKAAQWHLQRAQAACAAQAKVAIRSLKKQRDDNYTRYLRWLKANNRRITRLNRQARGIAAKFDVMVNQASIQANQRIRTQRPH